MKTGDKILTFTAIFISCLALIVSIAQTQILQKQSHAAVWPRLGNGQGVGPDHFNYTITNQGVGPAIVSSILYTYQDTSFKKMNELIRHFAELEKQATNRPVNFSFDYGIIYEGDVIRATDTREVFDAKDSTAVVIGKKYLLETDIRLDYCSIYETCWSMQNDDVIEL